MRAVEAVVMGRVQGVFYRVSCRDEAVRLGLAGHVSNRDDGAVLIRVEGDPSAIDELMAWCKQGPPAARVDDVAVTEVAPVGATGFDIRH